MNPADATQYKYKEGWEAFRVIREAIAGEGGAAKEVELTFTRHGPVVTSMRKNGAPMRCVPVGSKPA